MISNKNKVIVLLVSLLLVVGSVVLILNKDEKIKKVESDSKKYSKVNVSEGYSNPSKSCDLWFDDIEDQFVSYEDVVSNDRNLFIVDHCAWDPYHIAKGDFTDETKKTVCDMQKEFIKAKRSSSGDMVNAYNASYCKNYSGSLTVMYEGKTCDVLKEQIEKDYVSNTSEYNVFKNDMKCVNSVGDIDKTKLKPYYTNEEDCRTLKLVDANGNLYNGVLKPGDTVYETGVNKCEYLLYFLNGSSTNIDDYMNKTTDNNKKSACSVLKEYAQAGGKSDINNYNKYCKNIPGYQEIEGSDFTDNINQIHKTCDDAGDSESTLTSKIETTFEYTSDGNTNKEELLAVNDGYKNAVKSSGSGKSYTLNKYTKITCSESFQYTYPSIFETVKSGTYFELIYNPQIHSTYTCRQEFDNVAWEKDYKDAIMKELYAEIDKKNYEIVNKQIKEQDPIVDYGGCSQDGVSYDIITYKFSYYNVEEGGYKFTEESNNLFEVSTKGFSPFSIGYCNKNGEKSKEELIEKSLDGILSFVYYNENSEKSLNYIIKNQNIDDYVKKYTKIREALEKINFEYKKILSDKEEYYELEPILKFEYQNKIDEYKKIDLKYKQDNSYIKDIIKYKDTDYDIENYKKRNDIFNIDNYSWKITFNDGENINNTSTIYKYESPITRTKEIRLTYEQEKNDDNYFYADYQTGKITSKADTVKNNNRIDLGYVYPVDLNSSGERKISFKLDTSSDLSKPVKEILKQDGNNEYKCSFQITNDAVIKNTNKDTSSKSDEEKYKVKFYVRPIATNDIDPNNRLDSGLLGANWASRKGQLLMQIIQDKSKGNNTYNPKNLEYSFILSAQNIDEIRDYNKTNEYDDFKLSCNKMGGECNSDFLDQFENANYGNVVNTDGRNRRKYYIGGKWYWTDSLLSGNDFIEISSDTIYSKKYSKKSVYGVCNSSCEGDVNECYECLYRKVNEGVLP